MSPKEVKHIEECLNAGDDIDSSDGVTTANPFNEDNTQQKALEKLVFLKMLVEKYFNIVKSQVHDHIPKIVKRHLVFNTSHAVHLAIYLNLFQLLTFIKT